MTRDESFELLMEFDAALHELWQLQEPPESIKPILAKLTKLAASRSKEPQPAQGIPWDALQNDQFYKYQEARAADNERLYLDTKAKLESTERERDEALAAKIMWREMLEGSGNLAAGALESERARAEKAEGLLMELEPLAKAYREIGEAWKLRKEAAANRNPRSDECESDGLSDGSCERYSDAIFRRLLSSRSNALSDGSWERYSDACRRVPALLDRAAEFAKKGGS